MIEFQNIFCNMEWVRCPPNSIPRTAVDARRAWQPWQHMHFKMTDLFSARMHRERRHKPALDDTAVSVSGVRAAHVRAETQTKTLWQAFRLPGARFCLLLQPETAATLNNNNNNNNKKKNNNNKYPNRVVSAIREKTPPPTCASPSKRSHVPPLLLLRSGGY